MFRRIVELFVIASLLTGSLFADCPQWTFATAAVTQPCNVGVGGATSAPKRLTIGNSTVGGGGDLFISGGPAARTGLLMSDGTHRSLWLLSGGGASGNSTLAFDWGDLVIKRGITYGSGPDSSGTEIMRITNGGYLGLNTNDPYAPIEIVKNTQGTIQDTLMLTSPLITGNGLGDGTALVFTSTNHSRVAKIAGVGDGSGLNNEQALTFFTQTTAGGLTERMRINHAGQVGIGTAAPTSLLHLAGTSGVNQITLDTPGVQKIRFGSMMPAVKDWGAFMLNTYPSGGGFALDDTAKMGYFLKLDGRAGSPGAAATWNGLWLYRIPSGAGIHSGDEYPVFAVANGFTYFYEKVGIGTQTPAEKLDVIGNIHATGNIAADGTIFAKYQDVAEWVPSVGDAPPATVVVIAADQRNVVTASTDAYDTRIAGVVSAQPGLVLGEAGARKIKVATTGRVMVRVDATRAPIRAGDILVSSAKPGMAMKSEPIDVGGVRIHRPGTVIGKALEPLDSGTGEILVLLSLQ